MSTMSAVYSAQEDVAKMQSALGAVQTGLDTVETAAEAVQEVRRGLRRVIKVGLIVLVVGVVVAAVVSSKRSKADPDEGMYVCWSHCTTALAPRSAAVSRLCATSASQASMPPSLWQRRLHQSQRFGGPSCRT